MTEHFEHFPASELGLWIKTERKRRGLSQVETCMELTNFCGFVVAPVTLGRWERGQTPQRAMRVFIERWLNESRAKGV